MHALFVEMTLTLSTFEPDPAFQPSKSSHLAGRSWPLGEVGGSVGCEDQAVVAGYPLLGPCAAWGCGVRQRMDRAAPHSTGASAPGACMWGVEGCPIAPPFPAPLIWTNKVSWTAYFSILPQRSHFYVCPHPPCLQSIAVYRLP